MEMMMYKPFAIGCAIVVGVIWAWTVFNWAWLRPKKLERYLWKQGLRGSSYKLLFGDLKENSLMIKQARSNPINLNDDIVPRLLPFIHKSVAVYGKSSFTWLGPKPRVNVMDPELVKEVLLKHFNYRKPRTNPLFRLLANGLANHEGDRWVKHRKIINPAFHLEKLKLMVPAFCLSSQEIMSKWEEKVTDEGRSCELDVWPYLENLTRDAISRTAFGSNYEEGRRIFQLQKEQAELVIQAGQSLYVPGLRFFPTKKIQRMKSIDKEVQASLRVIINRRLKAIQVGETSADDLLGMMLESNLKEIQEHANNKKGGMSIEEVIGECKLFYIAGQETTSGLLLWTMILLSMHQDWQQRAREEVLQVFGNNEPNFDGLNNLKIVNMILHEVLRLYPPIVALTRAVHEEIKLGKVSIPAGTLIFLPILLIHHSKELWGEDANEFKPDRFSEGVSKATKSQVSYFPFGWGPRICIGQQFSMIEAKIAVSMILRRFSFELSPSYTHAPVTLINIQPQYGAHLILHKL